MLRNLGIRWKILAVLAWPVLVLMLSGGLISGQALVQAREARQVSAETSVGADFTRFVLALQVERQVTVAALAGDARSATRIAPARAEVDATATAIDEPARSAQLRDEARELVDERSRDLVAVGRLYNAAIRLDLLLPQSVADGLQDREQARHIESAGVVLGVIDAARREQLVGWRILTGRVPTPQQRADIAIAVTEQNRGIEAFQSRATAAQNDALQRALAERSSEPTNVAAVRRAIVTAGTTQQVKASLAEWTRVASARVSRLESVAERVDVDVVAHLEGATLAAERRAVITLGGTIAALVLIITLAVLLTRQITARLRRLTASATRLRDELPLLVEQIDASDDAPSIALPDVSVTGRDEVGRLAAAFRDVNATTVEIARNQAMLRASVSEMFVNVARRNQVLLSRQLTFIDQLERTEESPDALENLFRLDHLATRMRRNAESLLVLAGVESGRRVRRPMPLSDVIRTAVSEIEHYERVSVSLGVDPQVVAHLSLPAAHLLAELIENASGFSDPETTVTVAATLSDTGVRVTVSDQGLSMPAQELAEANSRVSDPPVADTIGSQRIGFVVVGRLAQRLDAAVQLAAGADSGLVATVDFPLSLFVAGEVAAPAAIGSGPESEAQAGTATAGPATGQPPAERPRPALPPPFPRPAIPAGAFDAIPMPSPEPVATDLAEAGPLPRRGVPVPREVAADQETEQPAARAPLPDAEPQAPADQDAEPQAPAEQPAAVQARSGLFSGFRSRREALAAETAEPPAHPSPSSEPAPAAEVAYQPEPAPVAEPTPDAQPALFGEAAGFAELAELAGAAPAEEPAQAEAAPAEEPAEAEAPYVPQVETIIDVLPKRGSSSIRSSLLRRRPRSGPEPETPAPAGPRRHVAAEPEPPGPAPAGHDDDRLLTPRAEQPQPGSGGMSLDAAAGLGGEPLLSRMDARERSAIASQALTELSQLSSYNPDSVDRTPPAQLTRRMPIIPGAVPQPEPEAEHEEEQRPRTASELRSMLTGFKAGVERGRTSPSAHRPAAAPATGPATQRTTDPESDVREDRP